MKSACQLGDEVGERPRRPDASRATSASGPIPTPAGLYPESPTCSFPVVLTHPS